MIKVVFDTNTLISAALIKGSIPAQALDYALEKAVILVSEATYGELLEKLLQPKFDRYVTQEIRRLFIQRFIKLCEIIPISTTVQVCRDSKDNKFLELGIEGKADYIVTGDNDLLILNPFRGIPILSPKEFLVVHNSVLKTLK